MKGYLFHTNTGRLLIGFGADASDAAKRACGDDWENVSVSGSFGEITPDTVIDVGRYWMYFTNDTDCITAPMRQITGRPLPVA